MNMVNKNEIQCSCKGKNDNCYRCGGWGYFTPKDTNSSDGNKKSSYRSVVYLNVTSKDSIKEHDIEARVNDWAQGRGNVEVIEVNVLNNELLNSKYSTTISVLYQVKSLLFHSKQVPLQNSNICSYPVNYNTNINSLDASKGIGYVVRENGKYGSFPSHDDYSDDSTEEK